MSKTTRLFSTLLIVVCLPLVMAMSPGDSEGPTRIPEPEKAFSATLIDIGGKTMNLTQFSLEGQVFLLGDMGDGQVAVPFEKIDRVDLVNGQDGLVATAKLKDGQSVALTMRPKQKAFGKAEFGFYRIELGDVASFTVRPSMP